MGGDRENEGHKEMFRVLFKEVVIICQSYGSLKPIVNHVTFTLLTSTICENWLQVVFPNYLW